jgi:hypothetical protein
LFQILKRLDTLVKAEVSIASAGFQILKRLDTLIKPKESCYPPLRRDLVPDIEASGHAD